MKKCVRILKAISGLLLALVMMSFVMCVECYRQDQWITELMEL